jgi:hypothetical protein
VLLAKLGVETQDFPVLREPLESVLRDYQLNFDYVRGSLDTRGYDVAWNAQARYTSFTRNKPFYILWVSPEARDTYRDQAENRQQRQKFATIGVDTQEVDIALWASNTLATELPVADIDFRWLEQYFATENIVWLHRFLQQHSEVEYERLLDINTGQAYLAIKQAGGHLNALVNLQTHSEGRHFLEHGLPPTRQLAQRFVDQRARWLLRGDS